MPQDVQAQAIVVKDGIHYLSLNELVPSTSFMTVDTPSGNVMWKTIWYLSEGNPAIPEKGVAKITLYGPLGHIDYQALIFPSGKVICIYHTNGSGNDTPNNTN
ncbi:hypothetical protein [Ancylomarina sp.]|uniref:hypothetical protein n=1 Tax=Ancylomarina sp. TaxID=1970196 RepID=UPI003564FBF7